MSPACIRSSQGPRAPQGQVLASRAALLPGQTAAPGARRSTEISRNKHPQHPKHQPRCEQAAEVKAELPRGSTGWGCGVSPKCHQTVTEQEELLQRAGGRGRLCATKIPGWSAGFSRAQKFAGAPGSATRGSQGAAHKGDASPPARGFLHAHQQQRGQHEPRVSPRGLGRLQGLN